MMLTDTGMKKKPRFPSRKSDFSRTWSTFTIPVSSRTSSKSRLMTLAGKATGRTASMPWLTQ